MRLPLCVALFVPLSAALAAPLEDARTVVGKVEARVSAGKDSPDASLKAKASEFRDKSASMAPAEAAASWLKLVADWRNAMIKEILNSRIMVAWGFELMVSALPSPAAWDELQRLVLGYPVSDDFLDANFRLFAVTLCNDTEAQWKIADRIRDFADEPPKTSAFYDSIVKNWPPGQAKLFLIRHALQVYRALADLSGSQDALAAIT